jgi:hypothetical protein
MHLESPMTPGTPERPGPVLHVRLTYCSMQWVDVAEVVDCFVVLEDCGR